jgi:hypothetical protein
MTNHGWAAALERMSAASRRVHADRLRSLTVEQSLAILEDLCGGIPEFDRPGERRVHPVGLCKIWKRD